MTDPLGSGTVVTTDPSGLPVTVTDPLGNVTACERDGFGWPVAVTDPLGNVTRYGWTVEGLPAWQVDPDGGRQEWTYDPDGRLTAHRDAVGAVTRYEYTAFGRLAARNEPDGTRYTFTCDTRLQLVAVTNPEGAQWAYRYDAAGSLVSETDFAGRTVTYTRDRAGRLTSRTNGAGQTVRYTRDACGRTAALHADGRTVEYLRDPVGRPVRILDGSGELRFTYDPVGRLLSEKSDAGLLAFTFDAAGRRVGRRTPSGLESRWTYDAAGSPTELGGDHGTMRFVHDAAGRETERAFGSAVLRRAWDGRHRQLGLSVAVDGRDVLGRRFTHRADGVLVGAEDALSGLRSYELDLRGRVTAVTAEGWTERYAYDPAGNVTRASSGTGETDGDRVVERGRLRRAGRASYEYDGQGRVVRQTRRTLSGSVLAWEYTWDSHDQLTSVQAEQWARRLGERRGEEPAVLHYRVPRDELDALHGRRFGANEDAALGDFIRNHRADTDGSAMHDYDMVEGKMLLNMNSLRDPNVPMRLGGRQIAFSRQGRADLVNRSFHAVHEVG